MKRLKASLAFDGRVVGDIMTPKSQIVTADAHDTLGPLVMSELHKSGHSRYPVIDGDIDHIVGMLYLKELIDLKSEHQTVRAAMNSKCISFAKTKTSNTHCMGSCARIIISLSSSTNTVKQSVC